MLYHLASGSYSREKGKTRGSFYRTCGRSRSNSGGKIGEEEEEKGSGTRWKWEGRWGRKTGEKEEKEAQVQGPGKLLVSIFHYLSIVFLSSSDTLSSFSMYHPSVIPADRYVAI